MNTFRDLKISKQLANAMDDLGFDSPTPVQQETFSIIRAGKNIIGIAQTGTGKTLAYALPILQDHKFSKQINPRVVVLVPTRELVLQVVEQFESYAKYINVRIVGVYGGTNINTQKIAVAQGVDILVGTPGRLYDLVLNGALKIKEVKKLVIDEVDVMLDLGFRYQINNIFELLPKRRQNIMFSATMTEEIEKLITDFFIAPVKVSIAVSGTPLENIEQSCYPVKNFYTKVNLLSFLLQDSEKYNKVLVFAPNKKSADKIFELLSDKYESETGVIHSNKSQNYRIRAITQFSEGAKRILVSTDVMARGLDINDISHVINFDVPAFPENYMHRIGRTGRAEQKGESILFYTEKEREYKQAIENLMNYTIPEKDFPEEVTISSELTPEERPKEKYKKNHNRNTKIQESGPAFHEKKEKNKKINQGGSYRRKLAAKYKKPKTRGDKIANRKKR